jgi:hypothetical protein
VVVLAAGGCSGASPVTGVTGTAAGPAASGPAAPNGGASPAPSAHPAATSHPIVAPPPDTAKPSVGLRTAPAVRIGAPAPLTTGVMITVGRVRAITVGAHGPGEVAGPAVEVPVTVRNTTGVPFRLDGVVVNASYGNGTPAGETSSGPGKPLAGTVAPGQSASGSYVFMAPASALATLRVEVASNNAATVVSFAR